MPGPGRGTPFERRLVAIVAMDVAGYSRLMGADEEGTLAALNAHRADLIEPAIAAHRGRIVKTTGDGFLLEFASVVDAVACAVAIQRGMLARNAAIPAERQLVLRIGVNIGDIIIDGSDIFGDGVNIAARLETLCEPGGICISRAANEQIRDKLSLSFVDLGEHMVKNIARAIGVYGLAAGDIAGLPEMPPAPVPPRSSAAAEIRPRRRRTAPAAAAAAIAAIVLAVLTSWFLRAPSTLPPTLEAQLADALAKSLPSRSASSRAETIDSYLGLAQERALAIAPSAQGIWRTGQWPSREIAEEKALERCQLSYNEPCAIVASGGTVFAPGQDGKLQIRDAPRVRHAGAFDPARIPGVRPADLERANAAVYAAAPGPKAIALHASGVLHAVLAGADQRTAEEQALRACNADPARQTAGGGPCFLYAAGDRVVLPLRASAPLAAPPAVSPAPPPVRTPEALRNVLLQSLARLELPATPARTTLVERYVAARAHKAMAVRPATGLLFSSGFASAEAAEERMLERCQVLHGGPCALLAVNDDAVPAGRTGAWTLRDMPRAGHAGGFEPERIPGASEALRNRPDVAGFAAQPGPKAAAYNPLGGFYVAIGARSQRAAEERVLADCNGDPDRTGDAGACLLYAIGNQVVLVQRHTGAVTAAP